MIAPVDASLAPASPGANPEPGTPGEGLKIAGSGIVVGLAVAAALGPVIEPLPFGILPSDAVSDVATIGVMIAIATDRLTIGGVTLTDATLRATTFMRGLGEGAPPGVMSASWFPGSVVTFDFPRGTFTIAPGALPAPDGVTIMACDPSSLLPAISVTVAGRVFSLHLDTGSAGGVVLPLAASAQVPPRRSADRRATRAHHGGRVCGQDGARAGRHHDRPRRDRCRPGAIQRSPPRPRHRPR
jgi:hypothetical protein